MLKPQQKPKKNSPFLRLFYVVQSKHFSNKSYTIGKILTVIDACIPDAEQRKAVKDLISHEYWSVDERQIQELKRVFAQFIEKFFPKTEMENEESIFWEEKRSKAEENHFPEAN